MFSLMPEVTPVSSSHEHPYLVQADVPSSDQTFAVHSSDNSVHSTVEFPALEQITLQWSNLTQATNSCLCARCAAPYSFTSQTMEMYSFSHLLLLACQIISLLCLSQILSQACAVMVHYLYLLLRYSPFHTGNLMLHFSP
ncbi:hypothetical protein KP509_19G062100 [Ceratopteris richardii]|uniref:Uncharacterized protein n=1 Tax=Ceratopteris richardii TaxID=49495 RepID=A0A8T2SML3_CERRI|nr:hypothetical protein KP509_19G062100 [Ceratopteris richardii]